MSYVAVKTQTGPELLFGRLNLEAFPPKKADSVFKFETANIIAGKTATEIKPEVIDILIDKARQGGMTISGVDFNLSERS